MSLPVRFAAFGVAAHLAAACAAGHAQTWPGKPVRMLVG